jgi:ribosomal protein L13
VILSLLSMQKKFISPVTSGTTSSITGTQATPVASRPEQPGNILTKKPEELIRMAVKGMLPKNKLGRAQLKKLKVYTGTDHPHQAQKPETLDI